MVDSTTAQPRRRASLPSSIKKGADGRPGRRTPIVTSSATATPTPTPTSASTPAFTATPLRTQATSPHIISSLLDQLSAMSSHHHHHHHFDDPPGSPSPRPSNDQDHLTPEYLEGPRDACEPPVVRTTKPPSGLPPLTASNKSRDPAHPLRRSGGSSCSLHSTHSTHSTSSFGAISIEPAPVRPVAAASRSSAESKRSIKGHRSLMYMSSRERLRHKETDRERERKRATVHAVEDIAPQLFPYEDTIKEEPHPRDDHPPCLAEPTRFLHPRPSRNDSPRRLRINLVDDLHSDGEDMSPAERGMITPDLIPDRGSSLRHSENSSRKSRRKKSPEKQREKARYVEAEPALQEKESKAVDAARALASKKSVLNDMEAEENEVTQRIRVLKEQKMQRERLAARTSVDHPATGASPSALSHVSADASSELSATSTVPSPSEVRVQDPMKAHRVLGIAAEAQLPGGQPETEGGPSPRYLEPPPVPPSPHRGRAFTQGDEAAAYPINYALALRRLEEPAPLSPVFEPQTAKSSPASSHGASTKSDPDALPAGSSSRAGLARRTATDSVLMSGRPNHKHSTSVTDITGPRLSPAPRSASADRSGRQRSMLASSSPTSNILQPRRQRTSKKRWSHPDLPAEAEKSHNARMERTEAKAAAAAVQYPERSVVEDRPASLDSIDLDVQGYLESPRLSQKIRHPQTGRLISFSEVGDPQGFAVFVCVGMGLTRYVMAFYDQLATTLKLRLITPDRPGIGGSQADPTGTPLSWPDDVVLICQALKISKFSLLAHSAGAVYALATSLRVPQHIRGRVHLLAPWIPPSQMAPVGISRDSPIHQLPRSQRFLRALPPSILKVANSTFLSSTSASLQRSGPKPAPRTKRKVTSPQAVQSPRPSLKDNQQQSMMLMDQVLPNASSLTLANPAVPNYEETLRAQEALSLAERERQRAFDERLTFAIWDRATTHANPATDLIVCLETKQPIGFRYEDINRPVVIHHGSKDSRVPVANVRWLGKLMRKCEVRILEGEPHGLMASAQVMGNVLMEIATDWEDWTTVTTDQRTLHRKRTTEKLRSQMSCSNLA